MSEVTLDRDDVIQARVRELFLYLPEAGELKKVSLFRLTKLQLNNFEQH